MADDQASGVRGHPLSLAVRDQVPEMKANRIGVQAQLLGDVGDAQRFGRGAQDPPDLGPPRGGPAALVMI